jgi:transcription elongation factor Elf1
MKLVLRCEKCGGYDFIFTNEFADDTNSIQTFVCKDCGTESVITVPKTVDLVFEEED